MLDLINAWLDLINAWAVKYSALVDVVLTTLLVVLTAFYAFVTRRMWAEMVEARLVAIRPIININARGVELKEAEDPVDRTITGSLTVQNFGRGPAYELDIEARLRYENEKERTYISTDLADRFPPVIQPGAQVDVKFEISGFPTPMKDSSTDFLSVAARCRDGEGNFYFLTQSYDLRAIPFTGFVSRRWQLRAEEWRFGRGSGRRRRRPDDVRSEEMTLLSRYRLPRAFDWSK